MICYAWHESRNPTGDCVIMVEVNGFEVKMGKIGHDPDVKFCVTITNRDPELVAELTKKIIGLIKV